MTIEKAVEDLIQSESFKHVARKDAKLRVFLGRYNKGEAKKGTVIEVLLRFGYSLDVKGPKKK